MLKTPALNALMGTSGVVGDASFFALKTTTRPPELFGHTAVLDPGTAAHAWDEGVELMANAGSGADACFGRLAGGRAL